MEQYLVTGMICAACSARVERAVSALTGVDSCSVSLLTNSMAVEGTVSPDAVIAAVEKAGYGATFKGAERQTEKKTIEDTATPALRRRLVASLGFLAVLMYVSMGHTMWGWPLPAALAENPLAIGLTQLLLTAVVLVINQRFFISGFTSLMRGAPNMDTLVALGSAAAFGYSTYVLYAMTATHSAHLLHDLYFESSAMILTLITVGKMLEARSKGRTTDALRGLMELAPRTATLLVDGEERVVPVEQVTPGAVFAVRPGETIPVDGVVLEGRARSMSLPSPVRAFLWIRRWGIPCRRRPSTSPATCAVRRPTWGRIPPFPASLKWWRRRRQPKRLSPKLRIRCPAFSCRW